MRTISCGVVTSMLILMGCSKPASGDAAPSSPDAGLATTAAPPAKDDACGLLSLAEIRRVLPEASRSEANDALADHGINACDWYGGSKKSPILQVSVWEVSGADDTPMSNASTMAMGLADPTKSGTQDAVRLEKVAGVGEDAIAIVEKADDARGILSSGALLTLQKNGRIAMVGSGWMTDKSRDQALKDLATLGKAVAARL